MNRFKVATSIGLLMMVIFLFSTSEYQVSAQTKAKDVRSLQAAALREKRDAVVERIQQKIKLNADRKAAAKRLDAAKATEASTLNTMAAITAAPAMAMPMDPGGIPHYFGPYPNYANSPLPAGSISSITVDDGGSGYVDPIVSITDVYGTGSGATASANAVAGIITGITVNSGGSGYSAPIVTINDATGVDAAATAVMNGPFTGGIRKFIDKVPLIDSAGANLLGQYIPKAIPDQTTYAGCDYYEIELGQYSEQLHRDLPPTLLRGYRQTNTTDPTVSQFHYLGPLIVATKDRPVRVKFTNNLGIGPDGDLFLPVDTTVMGASMGPYGMNPPTGGMNYSQNRATLHLHGGFVPWISDGTPHQWTTPAGEDTAYPHGVSVYNVPDMPDGGSNPPQGTLTFYYNNQQSARLMFYHDHSFGITRLNVLAGEAAGYLIKDDVEKDLIDGTNATGVNPGLVKALPDTGIPLIIQDKTFVDANTIAAQDPTWKWGSMGGMPMTGDLWYPHVYMPNQNPSDLSGMNAFGRWHYGPWFWPPTPVAKGPTTNPYYGSAPWEPPLMPATPNPSMAMEGFLDTPLVNGSAYPYMEVEPKAYRFRILNAANDRFLNLQMYEADPTVVTADGRSNTEVKMVPAVATAGYPANWPKDGREGGVPDPATRGPNFMQIGTEGGFLPAPVSLPNQPVDWNMDQTNFDMGVVNKGTLILGTAERADVVVDFSAFAGKTLILYNDAPAPFPAIDPRYDYYTGNPNQTDIGGTPTTQPGYGPNTRTIMQIRVGTSVTTPFNVTMAQLNAAFAKSGTKRGVFESSQEPIIMPQARYNSAYEKSFPVDPFVRIYEGSKTFQTVSGNTITVPFEPKAIQDEMGETYDTEFGRMSSMLGLQKPVGGGLQNFMLYGYSSPPVDTMELSMIPMSEPSAGDGTQIWKITHNGVDTHTIHWHLFNVQLINRVAWDNAVRLPDANELGWKETVRVNPLQDTIVAMRPVAPTQPFEVPNSERLIDPTMPEGDPLPGGPGGFFDTTGEPVTVTNHKVNFGWEYVYHCHLLAHEEMDMMHAVGLVIAPKAPSALGATVVTGPLGANLSWTDNSVNETSFTIQRATDSAFTVGLNTFIVGANATSFTDTGIVGGQTYYYRIFATNTIGDTTVYAAPAVGFPTKSLDSGFSNTVPVTVAAGPAAPTNLTAVIGGPTRVNLAWTDNANNETGFRIERAVGAGALAAIGTVGANITTYSDTAAPDGQTLNYRVIAFNGAGDSPPSNTATVTLPLAPPTIQSVVMSSQPPLTVRVTWLDNSISNASYQVQRALNAGFNNSVTYSVAGGNTTSFLNNTNLAPNVQYFYRVRAISPNGNSAWSATISIRTSTPATPSALTARAFLGPRRVVLGWTDNSTNEGGFTIQRSLSSTFLVALRTFTVGPNTTAYTDQTVAGGTRYYYRVRAFNGAGNSPWSPGVNLFVP